MFELELGEEGEEGGKEHVAQLERLGTFTVKWIRASPPLEREGPQVMFSAAPGTHGCSSRLQGETEQPHGLGTESAVVLEKPWEKARSPGRGSRHAQTAALLKDTAESRAGGGTRGSAAPGPLQRPL